MKNKIALDTSTKLWSSSLLTWILEIIHKFKVSNAISNQQWYIYWDIDV